MIIKREKTLKRDVGKPKKPKPQVIQFKLLINGKWVD